MHRRTLIVTVIAAVVVGGWTVGDMCASWAATVPGHHARLGAARRSARPDEADWQRIKTAAQLRRMGLAPHRTAHFRAFAGSLGLSQLALIQPLAPGPCRVALTYLYGNLLDLQDAQPGENWTPLRRLVAREPSIRACAPR